MSANIALKLTDDIYDVGFNWREEDALQVGESITASEWYKLFGPIITNESGSQVDDLPGASFDSDQSKVWFKGGVQGTTSKIKNTITTNMGRTLSDVVIVTILDLLDPNIKVPDSRRFRLMPTEIRGLFGEVGRSFPIGVTTTIAIDFIEDLPIYGRVDDLLAVEIKMGQGGGLAFESYAARGTEAFVRLTPMIEGQYMVRALVVYADPAEDRDQSSGNIIITAVA